MSYARDEHNRKTQTLDKSSTTKRPRGRPKTRPKNVERIIVEVDAERSAAFKQACRNHGKSVAEVMRAVLDTIRFTDAGIHFGPEKVVVSLALDSEKTSIVGAAEAHGDIDWKGLEAIERTGMKTKNIVVPYTPTSRI